MDPPAPPPHGRGQSRRCHLRENNICRQKIEGKTVTEKERQFKDKRKFFRSKGELFAKRPNVKVHLHEIFCFKLIRPKVAGYLVNQTFESIYNLDFECTEIFKFLCIPCILSYGQFHSAYFQQTKNAFRVFSYKDSFILRILRKG